MKQEEFLAVFDQYRSMVYALALSYTRSPQDAEDVCQTAFLKLLERPPAAGKEKPWLARVTVNECASLLRAPWRRRRAPLEDGALENLCFDRPEEGWLWEALGTLPPGQRALIHLRYYEGFSASELARQYHTTPQIISARLYRAKVRLKKRLEESGHGTGLSQNV